MIRAVVFDLDDTLVKTEELKALSYAKAAVELRPGAVTEKQVVAAFKDLVGRPREFVVEALMERFALRDSAAALAKKTGAKSAEDAFSDLRLQDYDAILGDVALLGTRALPAAIRLVALSREAGRKTALATMSHRNQVDRILPVLDLTDAFDAIATREDVTHGKPDPEIYLWCARTLGVTPAECLVVEDSGSGVEAAIAAGAGVIAIPTDYSRDSFRDGSLLDRRWVVEDSAMLTKVFQQRLDEK